MGNSIQLEDAKCQLFCLGKKIEYISARIREMKSVQNFDDLPFVDYKKVLEKSIEKCEFQIDELQKNLPKLVDYESFTKDIKMIKEDLENIQYRPDITDKEILEKLYPEPKLEEYEKDEEEDLFSDD